MYFKGELADTTDEMLTDRPSLQNQVKNRKVQNIDLRLFLGVLC